jgi:outer membrane lipoprotein-sorting protein
MSAMRIFESRPALRWLVPAVVVGVVGGSSLVAVTATADPALPPRTPEQLLVDLQQAEVDTFSGTVVQKSDLGLPELPGIGGEYDTSLTSLIAGTHTLQVWSAGEDKQRLAIHGTFGETDIIRNGDDLWNWSSRDNAATHRTLRTDDHAADREHPSDAPKTPEEAADRLLAEIEPTTTVSTDRAVEVADRPAYALVLAPKDTGSLLAQARIAVDAEKKIPLSVQVIATDGTVVFDVSFTSIDFNRPDDAYFTFNPPPGTKVTEEQAPADRDEAKDETQREDSGDEPKVVGTGWSTVVVAEADLDHDSGSTGSAAPSDRHRSGDVDVEQILAALPRVSGSWGSGRLLSSNAFSVVITDDGRIAAGAVPPEKLYEALG